MCAQWAPRTRCRWRTQPVWLLGLIWVWLGCCTSSALADEPTLTLRLAWGGGTERTWRGTVAISAGQLSNPQPLGLEPDEAGSIRLADVRTVEIRTPSSRTYDGVDIEVRGELSAKLLITLAADGEPFSAPVAIELSKLVKEPFLADLDSKKNRLLVRRAPGDALRVQLASSGRRPEAGGGRKGADPESAEEQTPALVFDPGQRFTLRVSPHLLDVEPSLTVALRTQLQTAGDQRELLGRDQELTLAAAGGPDPVVPLEIQAPAEPGVYNLTLTLSRLSAGERLIPSKRVTGAVSGLPGLSRLRGEVLAQRRVQFIVLSSAPQQEAKRPGPPSTELMTINPGQTWWDRVAHIPRIAGLGKDPLEFGNVERWEHPTLGPLVLLRAGDRRAGEQESRRKGTGEQGTGEQSDETWVAYPLSVSQPGQVHVVEVEYPSDLPQAMTISIVEPNASGAVVPIGLDSGVCVSGDTGATLDKLPVAGEAATAQGSKSIAAGAHPPRMETHRLTFWPRTRDPLLVISRVEGAAQAAHGRIRLVGPKRFGVGALRLGIEAHSALAPAAPPADGSQRWVLGMLERPLFPENFGAAEAFDSWSGGSLDDWTTFYDGGRRMIEYAQHAGYNALVVSVLADGSTIFPNPRLAPTPRYDSGAFFSTGQDPVRKDVLEMLLRLGDAQQIMLIPMLQFSAPLPELEEILQRGGQEAEGLQLIGAGGTSWIEKYGQRRGQTAYYNPLDPRVQQTIRSIVRELAARYGEHRSFGGLALSSAGPTYTLLPGIEWGLDDTTFARFCSEQGVEVPATGPGRFAQRAKAITGPHREAWLAWRAGVMHRFHQQMAEDLNTARAGARLLVGTGGLLQGPDAEAALRPTLPIRMKLEDLPLQAGIRPDLYRHDEGIVLLRPRQVSLPATPRTLAVELPVGDSPELDQAFAAAANPGHLLVHSPVRSRLASFDARSPFGTDKTHLSMVAQLAPGGNESRRRFLQAVGGLDSSWLIDGGWMLTLGEEEALRPLRLAFRRLPLGEYQDVPGETQGITCRWLRRGDGTYLYWLNPTPWPCQASLAVRGGEDSTLTELSGLRDSAKIAAGQLTVELAPYDLLAMKVGGSGGWPGPSPIREGAEDRAAVRFSNLAVAFEPRVREGLQQRVRNLVTRAALLAEPRSIEVLANAEFELPPDGRRELPGWSVAGAAGSRAAADAEVKHRGRSSAKLSSGGGVASLISDPFHPPQTGRISVAARLRTSARGPAPVLRLALGGKLDGGDYYRFAEAPLDGQWRYFIFTVDTLPLTGLSDLQVRFDLMGAGEVWVDDVVVLDLALGDMERTELSRVITRAQFSLEDGRLADCVRLLESYWPKYLEENVPLPQTALATKEQTPNEPPPKESTAPQEAPAAAVPWWKRGLPSVLR